MKKLVKFGFSALVLAISSCAQIEDIQIVESSATLTAIIEGRATKTSFVDPSANTVKLQWEGNEEFGLYNITGNQYAKYTRISGDKFQSDLDLSNTDACFAYYPYSAVKNVDADGFTVEFPAEQSFVNGNIQDDAFPMVGKLVDNTVSFKNLASVLAFQICAPDGKSDVSLESVTVSSDNAIAGEAVVPMPYSSLAMNIDANGSKSIVLDCGSLALSTSSPVTCYMLIPQGTYSNVNVAFKLSDDTVLEYSIADSYTFERSKMYTTSVDKLGNADIYYTITFEGEYWNSLIDSEQYGGPLLYGLSGWGYDPTVDPEEFYWWFDETTTLYSQINEAYGSYCYWSGGSAISDYLGEIEDGDSSTQLMIPSSLGAHSGKNFAVQYGYMDASEWASDGRPTFLFSDGNARVIKGFYITNTCYSLHSSTYGDSFNPGSTDETFIKAAIYCFNDVNKGNIGSDWLEDEEDACYIKEVTLINGTRALQDWAYVDLSEAGPITSFKINYKASEDMCGTYGLNWPAYCAIDDITVKLP